MRKPRADSARNRDALLRAAAEVFREGGAGASLEAVARRAGLGIGTLYRHFPTRDALFDAVYRNEVDQLAALAEDLAQGPDRPVDALRRWLHANVEMVATKKGMIAALTLATDSPREVYRYSQRRLTDAVSRLLDRAVSAGQIRDGVAAEDVLHSIVGMCMMRSQPGWPDTVKRLSDIFVDGLTVRPGAGGS